MKDSLKFFNQSFVLILATCMLWQQHCAYAQTIDPVDDIAFQYLFPSLSTSPNSSNGLRLSVASFHRFGVRKPYVLPTATKVAFNVFSSVFVDPAEEV